LLSRADLYHDSEVPELVEDSDDDEMPANADQQGDLPSFEWNHPPGRGMGLCKAGQAGLAAASLGLNSKAIKFFCSVSL
jgi:hypothetical protein